MKFHDRVIDCVRLSDFNKTSKKHLSLLGFGLHSYHSITNPCTFFILGFFKNH